MEEQCSTLNLLFKCSANTGILRISRKTRMEEMVLSLLELASLLDPHKDGQKTAWKGSFRTSSMGNALIFKWYSASSKTVGSTGISIYGRRIRHSKPMGNLPNNLTLIETPRIDGFNIIQLLGSNSFFELLGLARKQDSFETFKTKTDF